MTKKDYEKAAEIAQRYHGIARQSAKSRERWENVVNAFVSLFLGDNARFDVERFKRACVAGANVRARK